MLQAATPALLKRAQAHEENAMPRTLVPFATPDVSSLAKSLKSALDERHVEGRPPPSHVELLNLLARSAGARNFAALKAGAQSPPRALTARNKAAPAVAVSELSPTARKTLMQFDEAGRLVRLPNKLSVQQMAAWALWTLFAAHRDYTEKEVNAVLNANHTFGDPATLRRELVNMRLLGRESDCSRYWKEARRPDAQTQTFLRAWRGLQRS
jgi:hypothetical protein